MLTVVVHSPDLLAQLGALLKTVPTATCAVQPSEWLGASCPLSSSVHLFEVPHKGLTTVERRAMLKSVALSRHAVAIARPTPAALEATLWIARRARSIEFLLSTDEQLSSKLHKAILQAVPQSPVNRIIDCSEPFFPVELQAIIERSARRAHAKLTVQVLLEENSIPQRAITRRLHNYGLPTLRTLVGWHRALHAAHALHSYPERTVGTIAGQLDFGMAVQLCHHLKRVLHMRPLELRTSSSYARAFAMYEALLSRSRARSA